MKIRARRLQEPLSLYPPVYDRVLELVGKRLHIVPIDEKHAVVTRSEFGMDEFGVYVSAGNTCRRVSSYTG